VPGGEGVHLGAAGQDVPAQGAGGSRLRCGRGTPGGAPARQDLHRGLLQQIPAELTSVPSRNAFRGEGTEPLLEVARGGGGVVVEMILLF